MRYQITLLFAALVLFAPNPGPSAQSSAGQVIQQMRGPYEEGRQKTLKYSYFSSLVGYVTYRHVGEGGFFHVTTLADQVFPLLPDENLSGELREFLTQAEEQNLGVLLSGNILVWTDGSAEFHPDQDTRFQNAPEEYAQRRLQREEETKKSKDRTRQKIQSRIAETEREAARKKQEASMKKDVEEFEKALKLNDAKKRPGQQQGAQPEQQPGQQGRQQGRQPEQQRNIQQEQPPARQPDPVFVQ